MFSDPYATEAYLFHIALIAVEQHSQDNAGTTLRSPSNHA